MKSIACWDPGVASGFAWWRPSDGFGKAQVDGGLAGWYQSWVPQKWGVVVMESFDPRLGRGKVYYSDSSDIIGAAKLMLLRKEINELYFQLPSDYGVVSDAEIKNLGMWLPVQGGHSTVALKHLIRYMRANREYHPILAEYNL